MSDGTSRKRRRVNDGAVGSSSRTIPGAVPPSSPGAGAAKSAATTTTLTAAAPTAAPTATTTTPSPPPPALTSPTATATVLNAPGGSPPTRKMAESSYARAAAPSDTGPSRSVLYANSSTRSISGATSATRHAAAAASSPPQRQHRLMSLAEMSFKTIQTHLSASTDREEVLEIQSYISDPTSPTSLSPRFASSLHTACSASLDRIDRIDRAKKAAQEARIKAQADRPSAVVLDDSNGNSARRRGGAGRIAMPYVGPSRERKAKSTGGKKIWNRAMMASGAGSRGGGGGGGSAGRW